MSAISIKVPLSILILFIISHNALGQVQKGDNNIGFSSSLSTESSAPRNMNITLLLTYERYFTDRVSLGFGPSISIITVEGGITSIYGLNVFGNYYFLTGNAKLLPYLGIVATISQSISSADTYVSSIKNVEPSGNNTVSFYGAGVKGGAKYFITERINLDVNVNYSTNLSAKVNGESIDLGEGGIIQFFAGIGVIIGKKGG